MARDAGAKKVYLASCAPEIRFPNVYGIDMPSPQELVAYNKTEDQIAQAIGADKVIFQVRDTKPTLDHNLAFFCLTNFVLFVPGPCWINFLLPKVQSQHHLLGRFCV